MPLVPGLAPHALLIGVAVGSCSAWPSVASLLAAVGGVECHVLTAAVTMHSSASC